MLFKIRVTLSASRASFDTLCGRAFAVVVQPERRNNKLGEFIRLQSLLFGLKLWAKFDHVLIDKLYPCIGLGLSFKLVVGQLSDALIE